MGWGGHRRTNDPRAIRAAAAEYVARGFSPCALDQEEKKPTYPHWSINPLRPDDFEDGDGIGLMTGPISGGPENALVCVDLDSSEAVRGADHHLPATRMMDGRPSKPNSHRWYMVPLATIPADKYSTAEMAASAAIGRYGHPGPKIEHFAKLLDVIGTLVRRMAH